MLRSVSPCTARCYRLPTARAPPWPPFEGVLTDIDETRLHRRPADRRGLRGAGGAEKGGPAGHAGHRPAGRLVRPHRPLLAGRCRGGRERRLLDVARPTRQRKLRTRFVQTRGRARRRPAAARGGARPTCCARCRGRASPPTSPIALADLAIDFCEDVPPLPPADVDRIVAIFERAWRPRQGELDPRQRLVRRLRQAHHQPADDGASCSASISRRDRRSATSSRAIRPTTRRCSASFPMPWAWPTCATSPARHGRTCRAGSPRRGPARASSSWRAR